MWLKNKILKSVAAFTFKRKPVLWQVIKEAKDVIPGDLYDGREVLAVDWTADLVTLHFTQGKFIVFGADASLMIGQKSKNE